MADFTFYGSWKDTLGILDQLIKTGDYKLIANIAYKEPEFLEIQSLSEYEVKKIRKNYSIYIWSGSYSRYPISFDPPNEQGDMGIEYQMSGPMIQMTLSDIFEENGFFRISPGGLFYPPYFINPKTNKTYPPPSSMYKVFLSIKKILQKSLVKQYWQYERTFSNGDTRLTTEPIWIGIEAFNLMQSESYYIKWGWAQITRNRLKSSRN